MLYIAGETGDPCARNLLSAIELCEQHWTGDRAYADILFKLDQIEQELEVLCSSPGHRAAMRAHEPNMAGQIPEERAERPSAPQ